MPIPPPEVPRAPLPAYPRPYLYGMELLFDSARIMEEPFGERHAVTSNVAHALYRVQMNHPAIFGIQSFAVGRVHEMLNRGIITMVFRQPPFTGLLHSARVGAFHCLQREMNELVLRHGSLERYRMFEWTAPAEGEYVPAYPPWCLTQEELHAAYPRDSGMATTRVSSAGRSSYHELMPLPDSSRLGAEGMVRPNGVRIGAR